MKKANFGQEINRLRLGKKFGLRQFAREIGISATYVSRIEKGIDPPPSAECISKIARVLECDPDELFKLANKINPNYIMQMKAVNNLPALLCEISASTDSKTLVDDLIKLARKQNTKKSK